MMILCPHYTTDIIFFAEPKVDINARAGQRAKYVLK
jgi:hypothetical protein